MRPKPKGAGVTRRPVPRPEAKHPSNKDVAPPSKKPAPPTASPPPAERKQLDQLTASVLEEELQQIMLKVWEELPDDLSSEAELIVVNKLRSDIGNQFKKALGLNVTKRLLNSLNPLSVKVHFTTKPDRKYLRQFLKEYNFVAFKRIARVVNTFAAQVKTVADYDRISQHRDIHCGAAKITITPLYRFWQCPKNLKTIYKFPDDKIMQVTEEDIEIADDVKEAASISICASPDASKDTTENPPISKSVNTNNTEGDTKTVEKDNSKTVIDNTEEKVATVKNEGENEAKYDKPKPTNEISKPPVNTPTETKPQVANKTSPVKPEINKSNDKKEMENKDTAKQEETKTNSKPPEGKTAPTKTESSKPSKPEIDSEESKVEPTKTSADKKPEVLKPQAKIVTDPKTDASKATPKSVEKAKNIVKPSTISNKTNAKTNVAAKVVKRTAETPKTLTKAVKIDSKQKNKKSFEEKDDFEELDDEDILALMSGGIVLDECSGSDED